PFFDLGLDSLALLNAAEALEKRLGIRLYPTALFENPDVIALTAHLRMTFPEACAAYVQPAVKITTLTAVAAATVNTDPVLGLIVDLIRPPLQNGWKPEHAQTSFFELGLDSLVLLDLADTLEKRLGVRLYPTVLFERPDAAALASYLREEFPEACSRY